MERLEMKIEICAYSLETCLVASRLGVDSAELCAGLFEGGLTPSAAAIAMARELLSPALHVMIRPRGGDFLYSDLEFELMKEEIRRTRDARADGVVTGILRADGSIDAARTRELVELAAPLPVTFHRAFDMTRDPLAALEAIIDAGCARLLTSGCRNTVDEGLPLLRRLARQAAGRLEIMAGGGVNAANVPLLARAGVDAVHLSGKNSSDSPMTYRNPLVSMGRLPGIPEYARQFCDETKIAAVARAVKQTSSNTR
ncbi:MAG: copper homeostasis protein CutC [Odoribacteraceae bacterium]|jgi:copper homeostasis protein|nr:copper homeostasis protein CutC [Odoribacteraceae bacterium]